MLKKDQEVLKQETKVRMDKSDSDEVEVKRFDRVAIKPNKQGNIIIDSPILTRAGIFDYMREDGTIMKEYRPADVLFSEETMNSLQGIPITEGHVEFGQMAGTLAGSVIGQITSSGRRNGDNAIADVAIFKEDALDKGHRELSLGYSAKSVSESGTFNGQKYDSRLTKIVLWDHLALVKSGRAGNARLTFDSAETVTPTGGESESNEPKKEKIDMVDKTVEVRLDNGISYSVPPEVEKDMKAKAEQFDKLKVELEKSKAKSDSLEAKVDSFKAEIEKAEKAGYDKAVERINIENAAKEFGVEVKADHSVRAIQENVIAKHFGIDASSMKEKSDSYVSARFDIAMEDVQKNQSDEKEKEEKFSSYRELNLGNGVKRADAAHRSDAKKLDDNFFRRASIRGDNRSFNEKFGE